MSAEALKPIKSIEKSDLRPVVPEMEGTTIVLQRHAKYDRDPESPSRGSIMPLEVESTCVEATEYFDAILDALPENERDSLYILFASSDTQYRGGGHRSLETADIAQYAALSSLEAKGLGSEQIINFNDSFNTNTALHGLPIRPIAKLREPQVFNESGFADMLEVKYGSGPDFWTAYEHDVEKEAREEKGIEGPADIANRTQRSVQVFARYARAFHAQNPDKRLIIWADTHYDTISPYTKLKLAGMALKDFVPVDYGAGITIEIDKKGEAKTEISGEEYKVPV